MPYDPYIEEAKLPPPAAAEPQEAPQIDPADVQAFLQASGKPQASAPLPEGPVALPITMDELQGLNPEPAASSVESERLPHNRTFEPDPMNEQKWKMELPGLSLEVPVSDRVRYLKATLLDEPIVWTISVAADIEVEVKSLTAFEQDVVFTSLAADDKAGLITTAAAYGTWLQRYCAKLQILKLGGNTQTMLELPAQVPEASELLREHVRAWVRTLNLPAFDLRVAALRVFEGRMTVCASNLHNASFWTPASSAS